MLLYRNNGSYLHCGITVAIVTIL